MNTEDQKLEELKNLETNMTSKEKNEENSEVLQNNSSQTKEQNELDGYRVLSKEELPYFGNLYPSTWKFAYRCPTTSEIAEFSTIDERDQLKIFLEISKIISKCYIIVDSETQNTVNTRQINDGEKLFFFLKLREFYLDDSPITFKTMSRISESVVDVTFLSHNLMYEGLNDELLECYDGRVWTIPTESFGLKDPIIFRQPTLDITDRIFKYIKLKSQKAQEGDDKLNKDDLNKKFIVILPFLYQTGDEKIESLNAKFKQNIVKNENLYKAYVALAQTFNLSHSDKITFEIDEQIEETEIKFPGGWKKMFLSNKSSFDGLFRK